MNTQVTPLVSGYPLITRERTEKLELLTHLTANLAHAIVVCGPEGVGKTYLLKSFQDNAATSWLVCRVQGDLQLSLDKVKGILAETLIDRKAEKMPGTHFKFLPQAFDRLARQDAKAVLIVDDAGQLAPGVIEKIMSYARGEPVLRVIFILTHSELYLKNGTDPSIEDCYQIEIPPLSEKQCGEFLEYLSTLPNPRIQFNAINEDRVAALYRETHGIPGNILKQLPKPVSYKQTDRSVSILTFAVIGLIAVALGVQIWSSKRKTDGAEVTTAENEYKSDPKIQALLKKSSATTQTVPPEAVPKPFEKPLAANGQMPNGDELKYDHLGQQMPTPMPSAENMPQPQVATGANTPEEAAASEQAQTKSVVTNDEGGNWLKGQPVENYTLQVMALSDEQAIIEVVQRHQALGQNLKYLKTKTKRGRDRFILLYGSFPNPEQADVEKQNLPKELQKVWVRQFGTVQTEINERTQLPTSG